MASFAWANGRDGVRGIQIGLTVAIDGIASQCHAALALTAEEAGVTVQDLLEDGPLAFTTTGRERVASGRGQFAGRHVTGNMVGDVSYQEQSRAKTMLTAWFGWGPGHFQQYYKDQDLGEGNIPAVHALNDAFNEAIVNLERRLRAIASGTWDGN